MKKLIVISICLGLLLSFYSCRNFEDMNENPNEASAVTTPNLLSGAQKKMLDYIYDNWFSGRQSLLYSQYWAQNNYTEEDRYQIRESVNNNYFNALYTVAGNLVMIEKMNTVETTKGAASVFGNNNNQIAVAKILKVWLIQMMADTWGAVPYSEAFKLDDNIFYPKYDELPTLYSDLIKELDAAIALISPNEIAFSQGDLIYNGNAALWKKFGNSLKCRLAVRMSKVDANWKTYIQQAIASGVFTSNADQALFKYAAASPNECAFYRGFFVENRNDFSLAKPFVNIMKGLNDELNNRTNVFEGVLDPRLKIFAGTNADIDGVPYGVPSKQMASITEKFPDFTTTKPVFLNPDYSVQFMTYAELCFILSEYNNFDVTNYEKGIRASIEWWSSLSGVAVSAAEIDAYVDQVNDVVDSERVSTQKYIHLFTNGNESWAEYRRTGYPSLLIKPGDITTVINGVNEIFVPLSDTKGDIPARIKYPTNESNLNPEGFKNAVANLQDGTNNYYSKMFWDVRTTSTPHPANK
ncbi:MAG: SusD/RagB family nutrient-binding outer membrane lipoprotein [Breznakibacter sp.]